MPDSPTDPEELQKIEAAIQALKALPTTSQIETILAGFLQQKQDYLTQQETNIKIRDIKADEANIAGHNIYQGQNVTVIEKVDSLVIGQPPAGETPPDYTQSLQRYLDNLIETHRCLRLQGIRAGSQPLSVDLEKVYISLNAVEKSSAGRKTEAVPEKGQRIDAAAEMDLSGGLTIPLALQRYKRLVITGDPGCGKTTLLAYLALTYARALRDEAKTIQDRLGLESEAGYLPVLLPLRDLGRHLKEKYPQPGKDGPALLLDYLLEYYQNQDIKLSEDFFAPYLEEGRAVLLLDGMDEVAEKELRQRIARLIERFAVRYPHCRFIVTSRETGYEGAARVGAEFGLAKVRDFNRQEVRQFVRDWTRAVETTLAGSVSPEILRQAGEKAEKLIQAIEGNPRVSELAYNPLLLTVIALVHRYRAQLPERRSELYEEAIEVLLGRWDEAKELETETVLAGRKFDSGDRRSLLEPVAFWLHEREEREIERDELGVLLLPSFQSLAGSDLASANKAVEAFLRLIGERSGLLVERGVGVFSFAHLTFQEYLAARALADRADALAYTLQKLSDPWWREVILLEAGYLGAQGRRRVSELIRTVMQADRRTEPEPFHHLLLAAECLGDVGEVRVEGDLLGEVKRRLQKEADRPFIKGDHAQVLSKVAAMNALSRIESGTFISKFWKEPWGEPEWVPVPAGEFWMGSEKSPYDDERPVHQVWVDAFQIARVPITNAQYALFVVDSAAQPPEHWRASQPPRGLENHPVANISWHDTQAYCSWLGIKIGRLVRLPTEAEWEKAARGTLDQREYPWGGWEEMRCNSAELGLGETTPVGLFLSGASPYGALDMVGNVWEWCQSAYQPYPYKPDDGRENVSKNNARLLRGGSFVDISEYARCAYRDGLDPDYGSRDRGFRVVVFPGDSVL